MTDTPQIPDPDPMDKARLLVELFRNLDPLAVEQVVLRAGLEQSNTPAHLPPPLIPGLVLAILHEVHRENLHTGRINRDERSTATASEIAYFDWLLDHTPDHGEDPPA